MHTETNGMPLSEYQLIICRHIEDHFLVEFALLWSHVTNIKMTYKVASNLMLKLLNIPTLRGWVSLFIQNYIIHNIVLNE